MTSINSEVVKNCRIDDRLESYLSFFDSKWAEEISKPTGHCVLDHATLDLCLSWHLVANTHAIPWILIRQLEALAQTVFKRYEPMPVTFLKRLEEKLVTEIGGLKAPQRVRLGNALARMHKRVDRVSDEGFEFPISDFWRDMQKDVGIQFVILGSQRMCFGALYYAYEHFVLECTKLISGRQKLMVHRHEQFGEVFEDAFGQATRAYCWDAAEVDLARLVRNSIAHAGCRVTPHLEKYRNRLEIEGDEIQIMAPMTADLFKCLKVRALRLARKTASKLQVGSAATNQQ